jgi:hypothetical protein
MSAPRDLWFENALLLGILALLVGLYAGRPEPRAEAAGGGWETDGVIALSGAGSKLVLVDTARKNLCIYRTRGLGEFRLVGARSFKYDVEIKDSAGPGGGPGDMEKHGWTYTQVRSRYEADLKVKK